MGLTEASAFKNLSIVSDDIANDSITSAKIVDGAIVNADINASAAIAGTKINPNFGSQTINTTAGISIGGNITISNVAPKIFFTDTDTDSDFSLRNMHGVFGIHDQTNSADRLTVASDGTVNVTGNLTVTGQTSLSDHIDTNGKDVYTAGGTLISGDSDGAFANRSGSNIDHIWFQEDNSQANRDWNFCADTTYKAVGNAKVNAGSIRCYSQDAMMLSNPTDRTINDSDEDDPIHFDTVDLEKGGINDSNSKSRITVSQDGIYLITCCLSGSVNTHSHSDGIAIVLRKNGSIFPRESAFPVESFGSQDDMEWAFTFAITEILSDNDYLEVVFRNIEGTVSATLNKGYFCVTKLH